eukprot:scaffold196499_cov29-Tisochrysis_lutea.AAC.1
MKRTSERQSAPGLWAAACANASSPCCRSVPSAERQQRRAAWSCSSSPVGAAIPRSEEGRGKKGKREKR